MRQQYPILKKRILVGFNNAGAAGIWKFTRVLRRRGIKIDFYGFESIRFNMPVDFLLKFSPNKFISFFQRVGYFFKILSRYDIWHLNFLEAFFFYPLNLLILKLAGKKIILTCRGADVRDRLDFLPETLLAQNPVWPSYYLKQYQSRSWWSRFKQRLRIGIFIYFADKVVLTGPFLVSFVPHYDKIIPYARDLKIYDDKKKKHKLTILHVPTEPVVKGTSIIEKTFKNLQKKFPKIKFKILPKMSHTDLLGEISNADIVIDQLLVGWYGGQAVEALGMGKIVVCNIFPPYLNLVSFGNELPIWKTDAWSFEQDLELLIKIYPQIKDEWVSKSIKFAKKYHRPEKIANQYLEIYRSCYEQ